MGDKSFPRCKPLPKDVRSLVRSGIAITSVAQCVEELVLNSLDAKGTVIYVGVNLDNFSVRVEDNGIGLSKQDLEAVGTRYTTSKCQCLEDLSILRHYGYRGEALASIIEISASVDLIARGEDAKVAYKRRFVQGKQKGSIEKLPDSKKKTQGLTVVVGNLLSSLPVRQKRVEKSIQLEEIKAALQHIVLINPSLSIEFRNESTGSRLLEYDGCSSFVEAFRQLFGRKSGLNHVNMVEENHLYNEFFFTACIGKETHKAKQYQFVYVNKRYIGRGKIHRRLSEAINKVLVNGGNKKSDQTKTNDEREKTKEKYPVFIVDIKCPLNMYDITLEPKKMQAEFRDWEVLMKGLDGLVLRFQLTLQATEKSHIVKRSFVKDEDTSRTVNKTRNSTFNLDEDLEFGKNVTTHDVKRAIHSRFAVRDNTQEDCSIGTSNKSMSIQKSTVSSGRALSMESPVSEKKISPPVQRGRLKPRPTKTTTYDIRLRNGKRKLMLDNILPTGVQRPRIYVSKKPKINSSVFKKFHQWDPPKATTTAHSNSSQALSPESEVPVKKSRKSSLEERFGYKRKPGYSPVKNVSKNNYDEEIEVIKLRKNLEDEVNKVPTGEVDSLKWKMDRYLQQINLQQQKSLSQSKLMKSHDEDIEIESTGCQTSTAISKTQDTIDCLDSEISNSEDIVHPNFDLKSDFQQRDEAHISAPDSFTWAMDVCNEFTKKSLKRNCMTDSLKNEVRKYLMTSKVGRDILKMYTDPEPDLPAPKSEIIPKKADDSKNNSNSKVIFRPPTLGILFASNNAPSFSSLSASDRLNGKPQFQQPSNLALPLRTPDPFGINFAMKSGTSARKTSSISSLKIPVPESSFTESSAYFKPESDAFIKKPLINSPSTSIPNFFAASVLEAPIANTNVASEFTDEEKAWTDWEVDIVSDSKGQDWLQTKDDEGRKMYINLANGAASYDMVNITMETRISAGEAAKRNKNFRCDWLRRYFPRGSHKFWKPEETRNKIQLEGNFSLISNDNVLGKVVVNCIKDSFCDSTATCKWKDDLVCILNGEDVSEQSEENGSRIRLAEHWNRPLGLSEMPVSNLNAPEVKFWNKLQGKGNVQSSFRFAKQDLARVKVLTQLDSKFIVAKVCTQSTTEKITDVLVLFDQHAVHERIRLEQLLDECYVEGSGKKEIKKFAIVPSLPLNFSETEVRIMHSYKDSFDALGVRIEFVSSTSVKIASAPKCVAEKAANENIGNRERVMRKMLSSLLQEQVHHIIDTRGSFQSMPKTIFNILCSQACHGAIKFGHELDMAVCEELLSELKNCKAPFQCAHGRPALVPLLDLSSLKNITNAPLPTTHYQNYDYEYISETPDGTVERCSSQDDPKGTEEQSSYFGNSSGYFSSETKHAHQPKLKSFGDESTSQYFGNSSEYFASELLERQSYFYSFK